MIFVEQSHGSPLCHSTPAGDVFPAKRIHFATARWPGCHCLDTQMPVCSVQVTSEAQLAHGGWGVGFSVLSYPAPPPVQRLLVCRDPGRILLVSTQGGCSAQPALVLTCYTYTVWQGICFNTKLPTVKIMIFFTMGRV